MRGRTIEFEVADKRGKAAKTIPLYQYDYGQKLLIKGVELPEYYEVHFSNQQYGDAVTVLGDSTGVLIPDSLVATGETIYVWLFLHDTSYDGETEYMGAIPVIKRAQPTDVTPTPEEQSIITEVIAALNNMEDDMSEQVQAAESAKEAAQTAQTVAEGAATTASGYVDTVTAAQTAAEAAQAAAETAATSATASATSATSSANSANNALVEATNAKIAAVDAASAASTSATTATTASGNASNYATSAESAKVDAVAAQTAAEAAQTAAETAQGKAEDAQGAAETAQTAAEAAQTAAEAAQTAAETAQGKAEDAEEAAEDSAEDSEAYAVGTRNGVDVESDDPAYENNAKYYAEEAATVLEDKLDAPATAGTAGQVLTSDGEGGQAWADPSGAIDDTAGEGDTDVTWSADKLDGEFTDVLTAIQGMTIATASDVGKALSPKTVTDGEVTEWKFVSVGGGSGSDIDDTAGEGDTNKAWSANKLTDEFTKAFAGIDAVENEIGVLMYAESVVNGTAPNPSNVNAVTISEYVPATKGDKVKISTTRPVKASGNKYVYYFYEYDQNGTRVKTYDDGIITADEYVVSENSTEKVKWSIREYTSSDVAVPLREGDFNNKQVFVKVDKKEKVSKQFSEYKDYTLPFFTKGIEWVTGYGINKENGRTVEADNYSYCILDVAMIAGSTITGYSGGADLYGLAFYDSNGNFISGFGNPVAMTWDWDISGTIPANACTVKISCRSSHYDVFSINYNWNKTQENIEKSIKYTYQNKGSIELINKKLVKIEPQELRNGSLGNVSNEKAICTMYIIPIDFTKDMMTVEYIGDTSLANEYYWGYGLIHGASDGATATEAWSDPSVTRYQFNNNQDYVFTEPQINIKTRELVGYEHIAIFLFRAMNGVFVPLRIATDQYNFKISYNTGIADNNGMDSEDSRHILSHAKHTKGNSGSRLTLLHFSDIHKDKNALKRILKESAKLEYDDAICTGDIVSNSYEQIISWWNPKVLTCIGNHDTASYSEGTGYNWTALSMANRDAYYIAPFEENWDITHTSGTSYYYKDYDDAKVRLIVMDGMLYTDNGAEATAQTAWLDDLLDDAITNEYHVLIAIHAPHGGATAEVCSFSKYGQGAYPTYADCNTPQAVIDVVSTKITGGLKFIGYIVGHTHQDNIWDAENDGKQLMFCVTCAAVSDTDQWKNSDQHRDIENDAYNIVVIDTAKTLVKIIRGGGANIDDHMRTRKAICFDYSTGDMVGEVL